MGIILNATNSHIVNTIQSPLLAPCGEIQAFFRSRATINESCSVRPTILSNLLGIKCDSFVVPMHKPRLVSLHLHPLYFHIC
jgi:hypothetical protein